MKMKCNKYIFNGEKFYIYFFGQNIIEENELKHTSIINSIEIFESFVYDKD